MKVLTNDHLTGIREIYSTISGMTVSCNQKSKFYIASPFLSEFQRGYSGGIDLLGGRASAGAKIRLLTAEQTDPKVIAMLSKWQKQRLEIKINRFLHGKIYLFQKVRDEFLSRRRTSIPPRNWITLVGSSNFTYPGLALITRRGPHNLEIAMRFYEKDIFLQVESVFERWWQSLDSIPYARWISRW